MLITQLVLCGRYTLNGLFNMVGYLKKEIGFNIINNYLVWDINNRVKRFV